MPLRARNRLVVEHLHIVGAASAQLAARLTHVSRDELASAGAFALIRAADRFDASLGVPFGAFARGRVRWALQDELRAMDWAPRDVRADAREVARAREELGAELGRTPTLAEIARVLEIEVAEVRDRLAVADREMTSLDAAEVADSAWDGLPPDEVALAAERDDFVRRAVDALPGRKGAVIRAIYFDDRTVKEIAEEWGVSHAAVSQQRAEAVRMLRDAMDRHFADAPTAAPSSRSSARVLAAYFARISGADHDPNP